MDIINNYMNLNNNIDNLFYANNIYENHNHN